MPSSDHNTIAPIMDIIRREQPRSILDVGIGCGKFGMLVREYLDGHWMQRAFHKKESWKTILDGIEIWADYITPVHSYLYNRIIVEDAAEYLDKHIGDYDLILLGDVIEHFNKDDGFKLIRNIRTNWMHSGSHLVIATSNFQTEINNESLAIFGNKHEVRRCRWVASDFGNLGMSVTLTEGRHIVVDMVKR